MIDNSIALHDKAANMPEVKKAYSEYEKNPTKENLLKAHAAFVKAFKKLAYGEDK